MKRFFIIVGLIIFMAVPASASDNFYKLSKVNYPIYVNNQMLKSDLPILSYNGNTYIPLRKVSEATGSNTQWDTANKAVYITKNTDPKVYDKIKSYSSIMNIYKELIDFGDLLHELYYLESINVSSIAIGTSSNDSLTRLNNGYESYVSYFNTLLSKLSLLDSSCKQNYIYETENFNTAITQFKDILNSHSLAILNILKYALNRSTDDFKNYNTACMQAESQYTKAAEFCNSRYKEYFNKILLYECN